MSAQTAVVALLLCLAAVRYCPWAQASVEEPTMRELWRGEALIAPPVEQELGRDVYGRDWDFRRPDRGNFRVFSEGVKDLHVTEAGALAFTMGAPKVTLGWGNVDGQQPLTERIHLWGWANRLELTVRQSASPTTWRVRFMHDGQKVREGSEASLEGAGPNTLSFDTAPSPYSSLAMVCPDAIEIEVEGPEGNAIEITSLRITRNLHEGVFRYDFDLPNGPVWRAVAEVGAGGYLFVNGREVPMENSVLRRARNGALITPRLQRGPLGAMVPVDLAPYLQPGRNCVALYVRQVNDSQLVYLQGSVVMVSGQVIRVDSGPGWRYLPGPPAGRVEPGVDTAAWAPAETSGWDNPKRVGSNVWYDFVSYYYLIDTGGSWMGPGLPIHDGLLVIENPGDRYLFYDAARPVVARVRMPAGLAARQPVLRWRLTRAEEEAEPQVAAGEVRQFAREGDSLVCEVTLGKLERGVYALGLTVEAGQEVLEQRPREPLVVVGELPMEEVAGDSYEEGMKLTLEDTIDFTDPNDPHPWVETPGCPNEPNARPPAVTEPKIVRRNGLVYRETDTIERHEYGRGAPFFSYQFTFQHPGDWYLMVLEYPDDADRWIGVSCSTTLTDVHNNSKAGPSVWTGGKYPLSGKMKELRWIYRSGPGPHTIDIIAVQLNHTAAAARLRIYHLDELPALGVNPPGERSLGLLTERTTRWAGFGHTFGPTRQPPRQLPTAPGDYQPLPERLQYLREALDACEHYTQYLRFTGQNLHVMGCHQYSDGNTPFTPPQMLPASRVPRDLREMAVRVFGRNGISVIASIEYDGNNCLRDEYPFNDGQVALGADTALLVSREGAQPSGRPPNERGYSPGWNFLHPRVEELALSVAADVAAKFADQPNFLGVNWTQYLTGEWNPGYGSRSWSDPLLYSYDDATIARFEKDTGLDVPGEPPDPTRFAQRAQFLCAEDMRARWVQWRCEKTREFYLKARDAVRAADPDAEMFVSLYVDVPHTRAWLERGGSLHEFLREWGFDPTLMVEDEHLWVGRWLNAILHGEPARGRPGYAAGWEQNVGEQFADLFAHEKRRHATIMHQWFEINYLAPGAYEGRTPRRTTWWTFDEGQDIWPLPGNRGRLLFQPAGDNAREAFIQALVGTDPQSLWFGFMDVNMMVGQEQELREFARVFRCLPAGRFEPVADTGLRTNLAVRQLSTGGALWFYVANPGYWPIRGTVSLDRVATVVSLPGPTPAQTSNAGGRTVVTVDLPGYGVTAFRAEKAEARVVGWSNEPVAVEHLAHLEGIIGRAEVLLAGDAAKALTDEEAQFMRETVARARADLQAGQYARAWYTVTGWRFWTLLEEKLKPAGG